MIHDAALMQKVYLLFVKKGLSRQRPASKAFKMKKPFSG
jgi:hypothetical protein